jgi:hypothetical protein
MPMSGRRFARVGRPDLLRLAGALFKIAGVTHCLDSLKA